jgi:hypothetical protein
MIRGGWRAKMRPQVFIFAGRHLLEGWTVVDRLGEITVPTLVIAGHEDFVFPPECQKQLASGIPNARLQIIDRAGHNPQDEQTAEVMHAVREFLSSPYADLTRTPAGQPTRHVVIEADERIFAAGPSAITRGLLPHRLSVAGVVPPVLWRLTRGRDHPGH